MGIKLRMERGGVILDEAYLMIHEMIMQKYMRPSFEINPETGMYDMIPAIQYIGKATVYQYHLDRQMNFGAYSYSISFMFNHVEGIDAVREAYAHIHAEGLHEGWTISNLVDVFEPGQVIP